MFLVVSQSLCPQTSSGMRKESREVWANQTNAACLIWRAGLNSSIVKSFLLSSVVRERIFSPFRWRIMCFVWMLHPLRGLGKSSVTYDRWNSLHLHQWLRMKWFWDRWLSLGKSQLSKNSLHLFFLVHLLLFVVQSKLLFFFFSIKASLAFLSNWMFTFIFLQTFLWW